MTPSGESALLMNIDDFIRERKESWDELERIAGKLGPGKTGGLTRKELWSFGRLYIAAVADLSILRSSSLGRDPDNGVVAYLNGLAGRVHGLVYRRPGFRLGDVWRFIVLDYQSVFRGGLVYVLLAAGIMVLFGIAGAVLALTEPGFATLLIPEEMLSGIEQGRVWFKDIYSVAPMASAGLMTHNISVTFLAFAAGVSFGVGTFYLLAVNGLLIGAVGAACWRHDLSLEFWSFVLPHGSFEFTAIFIAGGAGLMLGHALLDPGPYRRSEILAVRGRAATRLALGAVPLLVVAGMIESFVSPSPLDPWLKLSLASVLTVGLWGVLLFTGRKSSHHEHSDESGLKLNPPAGYK